MFVFSQIHEDDTHLPSQVHQKGKGKSDNKNHSRDPAFTLEGGMALSSTVFLGHGQSICRKKGEESMKLSQKR